VTLGVAPRQPDLLRTTATFCDGRVAEDSIYGMLHRECFALFPDEMFADLFTDVGRRSVPPMIVAAVMVLQRIEGCSDREAVDRFTFDARWKYAAGGLSFDYPGFVHTVLVDIRARLARSDRPERVFQARLDAAKAAGLVGRKRVLDSTPLYDAVTTMDTVTLIRSASAGCSTAQTPTCKPNCERRWSVMMTTPRRASGFVTTTIRWRGRSWSTRWPGTHTRCWPCCTVGSCRMASGRGAALLASVVGQDLDRGEDGVFRIARRVAKDRVISTVDPQARHGHKSSAKGFDGYKGHVAIDPDSEVITATTVTAGNTGDATAASDLLADDLPPAATAHTAGADGAAADDPLAVYGDSAYGAGELLDTLEAAGVESRCKVQPPTAAGGRFTKDDFAIDLTKREVICPAGRAAPLQRAKPGSMAYFGPACASCPLAAQCTNSKNCRTVYVGLRGATRPRPGTPTRPRLPSRLPRHPAQGRTKDRAPDASTPRRTPRPRPRTDQDRRRLRPCWPPQSTSPDWPCSAYTTPATYGPPPQPEERPAWTSLSPRAAIERQAPRPRTRIIPARRSDRLRPHPTHRSHQLPLPTAGCSTPAT
jgi:DDE family transposase/transposase-like protein DUF772